MDMQSVKTDNKTAFVNSIDLSIHDSISSLKNAWLELEQDCPISVYQRHGWVEEFIGTYKDNENIKPYIIVGKLNDEIVFLLPLAIAGKYIKRIQFIGGTHSNFNLGIFSSKFDYMIDGEVIAQIFKRICALNSCIGYLTLTCQPKQWRGKQNPLMHLPHQASTAPAFVLKLGGSFEDALAHGNAKRKRKKFRQQSRMCESAGGHELVIAKNKEDISLLLETFLEQKAAQLKEMGIKNTFDDKRTFDFLQKLATKSLKLDEPLLRLYGLKVGGKIVATFGAGVLKNRMSGYFSSMDRAQHASLSPGEMLIYLIVQDACEKGYEQIDFGRGEERYKTSWSSEKRMMYDVIVPISWMSVPIVAARLFVRRLHRIVRGNPKLWQTYKTIRSYKAKYLPA
ncbi:MAG: GNAT family N-acetyltransferase [Nitratireductor sp.]